MKIQEIIGLLEMEDWETKTFDQQGTDAVIEFIAAELTARFNEAEPVMHRMWRDHVIMAVHHSLTEKSWLRIFKKKYFSDFINPAFPL